jgi:hypothetical protein
MGRCTCRGDLVVLVGLDGHLLALGALEQLGHALALPDTVQQKEVPAVFQLMTYCLISDEFLNILYNIFLLISP